MNEALSFPVSVQASTAAAADSSRSAEQCDAVISSLKKTRSKYVRSSAPYGAVPWSKQLRGWADTVRSLRAPRVPLPASPLASPSARYLLAALHTRLCPQDSCVSGTCH